MANEFLITDPDVLAQLDSPREATPQANPFLITDPAILEQLEMQEQASQAQSNALQAVASVTPEQWQSPSTPIDKLFGTLETAATIVSSFIAEPVAGIAGGVVGITDRDLGAAVDTIESVRSSLTYTPKTVSGNQQLEALGGALAPIGEAIVGASESLGDFGYRTTDSPEVAAAMYSIPTLVMEL